MWQAILGQFSDLREELILAAVAGLVFGLFGWFAGALMFGLGFLVLSAGGMLFWQLLTVNSLNRYDLAYTIGALSPLVALLLAFGLISLILR